MLNKNRLIKSIWPKNGISVWEDNNNVLISVVFTWQIDKALKIKTTIKTDKEILIGGPAISLTENIKFDDKINALKHFNKNACFTTRGCIRKCKFCAVNKIEGEFRELKKFNPGPIICDNNFLASSKKHFKKVIELIKRFDGIDFNQGLDARLLNKDHIDQLSKLNLKCIRFSWDNIKEENNIMKAINLCINKGISKNKIRIYVLIGFDDSPDDALYRLNTLRNMKIWPFPMRYQPLYIKNKNEYVSENWTDYELKKMIKYFANLRITNKIPYDEFEINYKSRKTYKKEYI